MNHVTCERINSFPELVEPLKKEDPFPEPRVMSGPEEEKGKCSDLGQTVASENLGMAMIYTLVSSAKEWLSERYGQDACPDNAEEEEAAKD
ncbi:hypothetical protein Gotur_016752 [Gossypium turneri]